MSTPPTPGQPLSRPLPDTASGPPEPFPLLTARTRVRRLRGDDLVAFQAIRRDPEVGRWQGWTPVDDAAATAFLAAMAEGPWHRPAEWTQVALADRATDALFGDIGLHWPASPGAPLEIGFSLARAAQGRGLAHEAVGAALDAILRTGVVRGCIAITDTRNAASIRLLERLGFERTATEPAIFREAPCKEHHYRLDTVDHLRLPPARATSVDAESPAPALAPGIAPHDPAGRSPTSSR